MKLRELLMRAVVAHVTPALAGALHRAGREDLAVAVGRWGVTLLGSAMLLEQLQASGSPPTHEQLRAACWALASELEEMRDPTAAVFYQLADGPAEALDLRTLLLRVDAATEEVEPHNGLEAADKIAAFWRVLRSFTVAEPAAAKAEPAAAKTEGGEPT